jgi:ketosteroid isomerase-like protein
MSDKPDLINLVNIFFEYARQGNFVELEAMMTDDIVIIEADSLPFAGKYTGKKALQNLYTKIMPMMQIAEVKQSNLMLGESSVCCEVELHPKGSDEVIELMEMYVFRGDKLCMIKPFYFNHDQVLAIAKANTA